MSGGVRLCGHSVSDASEPVHATSYKTTLESSARAVSPTLAPREFQRRRESVCM